MGFYQTINTWVIKYNKLETNKELRTINIVITINDVKYVTRTTNTGSDWARFSQFKTNHLFNHSVDCKLLIMCSQTA